MIPALTAFLQTVVGKVALGVTVAGASVGAAAAGAPVPIVQDLVPGADHSAVVQDEPTTALADTTTTTTSIADDDDGNDGDGDATEEGGEVIGLVQAVEQVDDTGDEGDAEDSDEVQDDADTHGQIVSEFATTTDLEGCERGQAVSAVARELVDPDSETFDDDLATYLDQLDKCNNTADDDAEGTDDESAQRGAPDKTDRGRPDNPGKSGERGNRPDHAGNGKP